MKGSDRIPNGAQWQEEHRIALQKVAAALDMTTEEFLTADTSTPTVIQARNYLHTFAVQAGDAEILAAFYLIYAVTRRGAGAAIGN